MTRKTHHTPVAPNSYVPTSSHIPRRTTRRTHADKLRRTISGLLEQAHAVEELLEIFQRKAHGPSPERAAAHYDEMLGHVDELGDIISEARAKQHATEDVAG